MASPRPSPRTPLARAAVAALLALTLLSSGTGTAARWSADAPLETPALSTGALAVALDGTRVSLAHTDLRAGAERASDLVTTHRDVTGRAVLPDVVAGDVVTVTTRATLEVRGTNLTASLAVDPGVPAGAPVSVAVHVAPAPGAPPLGDGSAEHTWSVTPGHHGASYDLTVSYEVLPGRHSAAVAPSTMTVTLTQN